MTTDRPWSWFVALLAALAGGSVLLFQGPEQKQGVEVVHDADAEPLD